MERRNDERRFVYQYCKCGEGDSNNMGRIIGKQCREICGEVSQDSRAIAGQIRISRGGKQPACIVRATRVQDKVRYSTVACLA